MPRNPEQYTPPVVHNLLHIHLLGTFPNSKGLRVNTVQSGSDRFWRVGNAVYARSITHTSEEPEFLDTLKIGGGLGIIACRHIRQRNQILTEEALYVSYQLPWEQAELDECYRQTLLDLGIEPLPGEPHLCQSEITDSGRRGTYLDDTVGHPDLHELISKIDDSLV